jgi:hypothetical protein
VAAGERRAVAGDEPVEVGPLPVDEGLDRELQERAAEGGHQQSDADGPAAAPRQRGRRGAQHQDGDRRPEPRNREEHGVERRRPVGLDPVLDRLVPGQQDLSAARRGGEGEEAEEDSQRGQQAGARQEHRAGRGGRGVVDVSPSRSAPHHRGGSRQVHVRRSTTVSLARRGRLVAVRKVKQGDAVPTTRAP